jgi:hypothetical protein
MNAMSSVRKYTVGDIKRINSAIYKEFYERKGKGSTEKYNTNAKRHELDGKIARILNEDYRPKIPYCAEDVRLYKKCRMAEYEDRTGKCAWGYRDTCAQR